MPYEVTATRKRPQTFAELVGQEFVAATLTSAIRQGAHRPRLPVRRAAGRRQDLGRAHPRQGPQLREGPHRHALRHLPGLPRHRARRRAGRHRDRRRLQHQRQRRARDPRRGALRPAAGPVQGLHHRRGAHALQQRVQRAAEDHRGAAPVRGVHLRHHRAPQGPRDHPLALPAVQLPAHLDREIRDKLREAAARAGRAGRGQGAHLDREGVDRVDARRLYAARPGRLVLGRDRHPRGRSARSSACSASTS